MRRIGRFAAAVVCVGGLALATACGSTSTSSQAHKSGSSSSAGKSGKITKVGMAYDVGGRGDQSFNDSAARGLDKAKSQYGFTVSEQSAQNGETDAIREQRLEQLAAGGYNPVIAIGYTYAPALGKVAKKYPNTEFAIVDDSTVQLKNVADLMFTEQQSSYLVGMAAALTTKTNKVGFIGGVDNALIHKFDAGFTAGVHHINPKITVIKKYLSEPPDTSGYANPTGGKNTANGMLSQGADVIYSAAGSSGTGAIQAVHAAGKGKWAIGVDSDQYQQKALAADKSSILTSALKNVDSAVYLFLKSVQDGKPLSGTQRFNLTNNGVGYATSGNFLTSAVQTKLKAAEQDIISGKITVPTTP
ncbi:BMP family ABC transporter substrate-binding protein [Mangrovactinospora gilvigrisea]|uniref:BMP family ABC transporter substrate-binding protein n=1 Tax=Mangrovactinospora gilvigrisea TaxID=1428644 RepID=A0A1J7BUN4_9ACTN|nr:BMP family ABC transporter substrate-binding protein [Mangrovactinospora gilvigrisea]OIV37177.1 BMP family ABC transporter substrate-binding protein [Mangrovactinospora gilvigrisea]